MISNQFYSGSIEYDFWSAPTGKIFTAIHSPKNGQKKCIIVLLNPIFEERSRSHRYLYNWSRYLAYHGYMVIRFDYIGQGDSDGDSDKLTLKGQLDTLAFVIEYVKKHLPSYKIGIHGLRWGASVAKLFTIQNPVDHLVLWEPILDGRDYLMKALRMNLATQLIIYKRVVEDRKALVGKLEAGQAVNIDGYHLSPDLWKQSDMIDLKESICNMPTLLYKFGLSKSKIECKSGEMVEDKSSQQNMTLVESVVDQFYLEIKTYTNYNEELFNSTLHWIENYE